MNTQKTIKNKWLTVRMSEQEYSQLGRLWKKTTFGQMSEYVRSVILQKPVHIKYRNASADAFLSEIIILRNEFKAVGVNFNQVVHKLHTLEHIPEFRSWMALNERHKEQLFIKMKEIQDRVNAIYQLWLSNSQNTSPGTPEKS